MHKAPTGRLLPCQLEMLPRYIEEAITEGAKCYICALIFLWREREKERERERERGRERERVTGNSTLDNFWGKLQLP